MQQMPSKRKSTRNAPNVENENEERAAKETKVSPRRTEDMFRMLVSSRLFEAVLAPYCTTRMLAFLSTTCRLLEAPVLPALTARKRWRLSIVNGWTHTRLAYVHHLLYDYSS